MVRSYALVLLLSFGLLTTTLAAKSDARVTVYITRTGTKYHKASCRTLRRSKIKITLKEAKERGYEQCHICYPPE